MKQLLCSSILIILAVIILMPAQADALEPKLLWEKELPFEVTDIEVAELSGDVLLHSQKARQIIVIDKNGNEVFHWGPRVDRQPMGADISADGSVITYTTTWTESYVFKNKLFGQWDDTLHFATRKGKELWTWKMGHMRTELSPDGTLVAVTGSTPSEGYEGIVMLNAEGKELWSYKGVQPAKISFSPDSGYIVGADGDLYLLTRDGELVWKKKSMFAVSSRAYYATNGAEFVYSFIDEKAFDKEGNLAYEGDFVFTDTNKKINIYSDEVSTIYSLPDQKKIMELNFYIRFLSDDGRLMRRSFAKNLYIYDAKNDKSAVIPINAKFWVIGSTRDGKYLIVIADDKRMLYYQVY